MICTKSEMFDLLAERVAMLEYDLEDRVITWASRPLEERFGYLLRGELEGQPVETLLPTPLRESHEKYIDAYAESPDARTMSTRPLLQGRRKDGTLFPVVVGLYPAFAGTISNRRRIVIAIVFDMSAGETPLASHGHPS